eukprot:gene16881-biopygen20326
MTLLFCTLAPRQRHTFFVLYRAASVRSASAFVFPTSPAWEKERRQTRAGRVPHEATGTRWARAASFPPLWEKRQRTRTGRGPHDRMQRNGRGPDAGSAVPPCDVPFLNPVRSGGSECWLPRQRTPPAPRQTPPYD